MNNNKLLNKLLISLVLMVPLPGFSQTPGFVTPIDQNVDTGSHTCTSQGQDIKVYKSILAGENRYFINENLSVVSQFGAGSCEYSPDHVPDSYVKKIFCVTDADGQQECTPKLVQVIIRAYADCTNNPLKLGSRIGTECRFTATSKRGNPQ